MADDELPAPLVPAEVELSGMSGFMLNAERLLASELVALASPEEGWAAFMLWCRAWQQKPAGSLPNDNSVLAAFSRAGKRWGRVRHMALRGFVLCSDGRLYHRVLCEEVMRAWKKRQQYRSDQDRLKRWRDGKRNEPGNEDETLLETRFNGVSGNVSEPEETGTGTVKKENPSPESSETPTRGRRQSAAAYAFEGQVIRLTKADLDRWKASYAGIPDIIAELTTIDAKFAADPPKQWFATASAWLQHGHERRLRAEKQPSVSNGAEDDWMGASIATWRRRVANYRADPDSWISMWGFPPGDRSCDAPDPVLAEFGFARPR